MTVEIDSNTVTEDESNYGINVSAGDTTAAPQMNVNIDSNTVTQEDSRSEDGITVDSGINPGDTDTVCLNATGNHFSTAIGNPGSLGFAAAGLSVVQNTATSFFQIQGYTGAATNDSAVEGYLSTHPGAPDNVLSGPATVDGAFSQHITNGFTNATCATPPAGP